MRRMASASSDGLSSTGSSSHPAINSFSGGEINNYSTFSALSELDGSLVRPEILIAVDGVQFGGSVDYKCSTASDRNYIQDSSDTLNDKGLISIDSMGHSATIPAITTLEDPRMRWNILKALIMEMAGNQAQLVQTVHPTIA